VASVNSRHRAEVASLAIRESPPLAAEPASGFFAPVLFTKVHVSCTATFRLPKP
jgi:hypothetical protein